jgi:hypothetical protein
MILRPQSVLITVLFIPSISAAAGDQPFFAPNVEQWGVQEVTLRSPRTYENPFADVRVQGRFQSQGKAITVDGFYDGDHTWKIRFMPETPGTWTFTTVSTDSDLDGKSGSFVAASPARGNHGPVVGHNRYHFAYADGTLYFPLGTTLYNWLNSGRDLEIRTLATLSRNPFNKVRFLVFPKWMLFNHVEPPRFPYIQTASGKVDLDRFDPDFFAY